MAEKEGRPLALAQPRTAPVRLLLAQEPATGGASPVPPTRAPSTRQGWIFVRLCQTQATEASWQPLVALLVPCRALPGLALGLTQQNLTFSAFNFVHGDRFGASTFPPCFPLKFDVSYTPGRAGAAASNSLIFIVVCTHTLLMNTIFRPSTQLRSNQDLSVLRRVFFWKALNL